MAQLLVSNGQCSKARLTRLPSSFMLDQNWSLRLWDLGSSMKLFIQVMRLRVYVYEIRCSWLREAKRWHVWRLNTSMKGVRQWCCAEVVPSCAGSTTNVMRLYVTFHTSLCWSSKVVREHQWQIELRTGHSLLSYCRIWGVCWLIHIISHHAINLSFFV